MKRLFPILLPCLLALLVSLPARALVPEPPDLNVNSFVLFDFQSGQVIAEKNAHERVEPASITKIMTAFVAFDELQQGHVTMDDDVLISEKAWRTPGSRTFVEVGKKVGFRDLLHGSITQSGNDATVAIAEHIAGDESVFAQLMNQHAQQIGMKDTHFVNATGLPDPEHYTTAYDIALLARALIQTYPERYKIFSEREFTFGHRGEITQRNRNLLLQMDSTADGIKTGHTESAGYCLAGSAIRDGRRLISVVMGAGGPRQRAQDSKTLLDYGFRFFENVALFGAEKPVSQVQVWQGAVSEVAVGVPAPIVLTVPRGEADKLTVTPHIEGRAIAPLAAGQQVGTVTLSINDQTLRTLPLQTLQPVAEGSLLRRLIDAARLWLEG